MASQVVPQTKQAPQTERARVRLWRRQDGR